MLWCEKIARRVENTLKVPNKSYISRRRQNYQNSGNTVASYLLIQAPNQTLQSLPHSRTPYHFTCSFCFLIGAAWLSLPEWTLSFTQHFFNVSSYKLWNNFYLWKFPMIFRYKVFKWLNNLLNIWLGNSLEYTSIHIWNVDHFILNKESRITITLIEASCFKYLFEFLYHRYITSLCP